MHRVREIYIYFIFVITPILLVSCAPSHTYEECAHLAQGVDNILSDAAKECFQSLNVDSCKILQHDDEQEVCRIQILAAYLQDVKDPAGCEDLQILNPLHPLKDAVSACYVSIAVREHNPLLCAKVRKDFQDNCYENVIGTPQ